MTEQELRKALEPLTIKFRESRDTPTSEIVSVAQIWMNEGTFESITEAFEIWDRIVLELAQQHVIGRN